MASGHTSLGTRGWFESLRVDEFRAIFKMVGGLLDGSEARFVYPEMLMISLENLTWLELSKDALVCPFCGLTVR